MLNATFIEIVAEKYKILKIPIYKILIDLMVILKAI